MSKPCLFEPSLERARMLTVAFSCYHSLKLGHRELVDLGIGSGNFDDTLVKLVSLADAFSRELL